MHERVLSTRLIRSGDLPSAERRALQRSVRRGHLDVVRPGVFVDHDLLAAFTSEERHLLLLRATLPSITLPRFVSHVTAAAVHGLPFTHTPPDRLELTDPTRTRTSTSRFLHIRADPSPDTGSPASFEGVIVSSVLRTAIDIAAVLPIVRSVPMIDHVLRTSPVSRTQLLNALSDTPPHAAEKARRALELGSALSESPAESLCRVRFVQLRTPQPVQQHVFVRAGERPARVDFWFPDQGVVVEVDGRAKYAESGDVADAHWREKRREDFIRSFPEVRTVVRLSWSDLMDPERVRAALRRAGVPCR